ncbi:Centrosomal protein of 19 kDa [Blattella germanica]|nr:Centrosomal protein of 19 kDa [Blattella germanica]
MNSTAKIIVAKKCGIRFSPPALIVVYEEEDRHNVLRKFVMPIRNFRITSSVSFVAQDLKTRHSKVLNSVSNMQVEKMLRVLQEHMKNKGLNEAVEVVTKEFTVLPDEDLNKLGDDEIKRKKEIMDESFSKNRVKPGDPDFVYDKRVDFENNIGNEKVEYGWDEEESDNFWN